MQIIYRDGQCLKKYLQTTLNGIISNMHKNLITNYNKNSGIAYVFKVNAEFDLQNHIDLH